MIQAFDRLCDGRAIGNQYKKGAERTNGILNFQNSVRLKMFPSGSLNQAIFALAGDFQIPRES